MATADIVYNPALSGGADAGSPKQTYTAIGRALAGLSTDCLIFWEDWEKKDNPAPGWNPVMSAGASGTRSATDKSTVVLDSGATAGSTAMHETGTEGGVLAGAAGTDKWYCAFRMKVLTSTFNTTSMVSGGVSNSARTSSIVAGQIKNAANFRVEYDGNFELSANALDFGVARDASFHIYELWHPGDGKLHARLDGGVEVNATLGAPPTQLNAVLYVVNGSGAVSHQGGFDWYLFLGPRS